MKYTLEIRQEALLELTQSIIWYEEQLDGLGLRFREAIHLKLEQICRSPFHYQKTYKDFHEVLTDGFPFVIIYYVDEKASSLIVISIFHTSRNPKKKFKK